MSEYEQQFVQLIKKQKTALIKVFTLGRFEVLRENDLISSKDWGRDRTIQLFQFLITARHRGSLHKEQIMDRIWEEDIDQNFKVALHGINKVLEPGRPSRVEPRYVIRQGNTYQLNQNEIWIDVDHVDKLIEIANNCLRDIPHLAIEAYREAIKTYKGDYLPNRIYEDWSSEERERIQILVMGAMMNLSELIVEEQPLESVRIADEALQMDHAWEDAYRIKMKAYIKRGNRPMAIKTYEQCTQVLQQEFGINPLPETTRLFEQIMKV